MAKLALTLISLVAAVSLASPAMAAKRCHRGLHLNKTGGAIAGGVGGALIGKALIGGTGGAIVGVVGGGLAGHSLAHNRRRHPNRCR